MKSFINSRGARMCVRIAAVVCFLIGAGIIFINSGKILKAGVFLLHVKDEVEGYDRFGYKPNAYLLSLLQKRQAMIHSSDPVYHWFANTNDFLQALSFLLSIIGVLLPICLIIMNVYYYIQRARQLNDKNGRGYDRLRRLTIKQERKIQKLNEDCENFEKEIEDNQYSIKELTKELDGLIDFCQENAPGLVDEYFDSK